jgi:hypothetical protein
MCDKCRAIDSQIERYRDLGRRITDQQTLEAIERLVRELEAGKKALHPEE